MNLLFCSNDSFSLNIKELVYSIYLNNKTDLNVYLMYSNISDVKIKKLEKFLKDRCHAKFYPIKIDPSFLNKVPKTTSSGDKYFGAEAYFRLFAQFYLPKTINKILYLDIDLICNGNIMDLYNTKLGNKAFAGCRDYGISLEHFKSLGCSNIEKYINTGVLLINLELLRKKLTFDEICNYAISKKNVIEFADQDVINPLYENDILIVSNVYNYTLHSDLSFLNIQNPSMIHFSGIIKAWGKDSFKIKAKYMNIYYKYYNHSKKILFSFKQLKYNILRFMYICYKKIKGE